MLRTLYSKLAAVLLGLFALVGASAIFGTLHFFGLYNEEATQRLNANLARHLTSQNMISSLEDANPTRLRNLFDMQMAINPSIQIYLLDAMGRVVACAVDLEALKTRPVDLGPVHAFLAGEAKFPLRGDDPRQPGARRIFSAAPIPSSGRAEGYLYVVLTDQVQQSGALLLRHSSAMQLAALVAGGSLLLALLAGLGLFAFITRKLERLAASMEEFQRADFSRKPAGLPSRPGGSDEIDRLAATFQEMSSRMVAQVQKLKRTDVLRRELVANVSHDLKTPLATLQGYVDTLLLKEDSLSPQERHSYLLVASRSCERLGKLVGDLIELAKLDAQEITPDVEAFSASELVQDVAQKFELKATQKKIRLHTDFPERMPYVLGDIGLIERVLENLIGNALTHTGPDGAIRLTLTPKSEHVTIQVSDTGSGIPEDEIPHIFERFYRVERGGWEQGGHAGLGLAITKSILDLHGTRMRVESQIGVGTSFSFDLPLAALQPAPQAIAA